MNAQPITDEDRLRQMVLAELDYHMARDQTLVLLEDLGDAALCLRRAWPELVVLVLIDPMQHYPSFPDAFLAALKRHGQVQEDAAPLKPGVTHVIERVKGKPRLVRKRFSAI